MESPRELIKDMSSVNIAFQPMCVSPLIDLEIAYDENGDVEHRIVWNGKTICAVTINNPRVGQFMTDLLKLQPYMISPNLWAIRMYFNSMIGASSIFDDSVELSQWHKDNPAPTGIPEAMLSVFQCIFGKDD